MSTTSSMTSSAIETEPVVNGAGIEADPAELSIRADFQEWLRRIGPRPDLHGRFVNTLSLLEHIGSVKIARSQTGDAITEQVLEHLSEEARHAYLLKRMSGKISGGDPGDYSDERLLEGPAARRYFTRLDAVVNGFCRRELDPAIRGAAAYNLVTWLVEKRAMWLYPMYQTILEENGATVSVRSIIGEETRHLAEIEEGLQRLGLDRHPGLERLTGEESLLFRTLATSMMAGTPATESAPGPV